MSATTEFAAELIANPEQLARLTATAASYPLLFHDWERDAIAIANALVAAEAHRPSNRSSRNRGVTS